MSFDLLILSALFSLQFRLNPFRTGRCLSTAINFLNSFNKERSQSLSIRAMSFDCLYNLHNVHHQVSQSLSIRAMSFDVLNVLNLKGTVRSLSLSSRAMSFDALGTATTTEQAVSQSLSSRAMSFDQRSRKRLLQTSTVSIPFDQGDVFRHVCTINTRLLRVSIPFDQGDVFRLRKHEQSV